MIARVAPNWVSNAAVDHAMIPHRHTHHSDIPKRRRHKREGRHDGR